VEADVSVDKRVEEGLDSVSVPPDDEVGMVKGLAMVHPGERPVTEKE
jgi:hypothetical protein